MSEKINVSVEESFQIIVIVTRSMGAILDALAALNALIIVDLNSLAVVLIGVGDWAAPNTGVTA